MQVEEEDGMTLEPFNLTRERAEGHFDESGHYVEHKADDGDRDAWFDSGEYLTHNSRDIKVLDYKSGNIVSASIDAPLVT